MLDLPSFITPLTAKGIVTKFFASRCTAMRLNQGKEISTEGGASGKLGNLQEIHSHKSQEGRLSEHLPPRRSQSEQTIDYVATCTYLRTRSTVRCKVLLLITLALVLGTAGMDSFTFT